MSMRVLNLIMGALSMLAISIEGAANVKADDIKKHFNSTVAIDEVAVPFKRFLKASGTNQSIALKKCSADFQTNRTGFVVLHPLEGVAGQSVEIGHVDGTQENAKFPKFISPGQPVFEIRSLKHGVMPGLKATVIMEGNKFEMEDHRNWMDASFKTYVCSLLDPWPYTLPKGQSFEQSITLKLEGKPKASKQSFEG